MAENLFRGRVRRNVSQVNRPARSRNDTRVHCGGRGWLHLHLAAHVVVGSGRGLRPREELGGTVRRGRDHGLVSLRHVLLNWASNSILLLLTVMLTVLLLEGLNALELRATKSAWASRLERAAEQELGRKQGRKLHIEGSARSGHIMTGGRDRGLLVHLLRIDRRDISPARMPIGETGNVRSESAVREARVSGGRLGRVAEPTVGTGCGAGRNARACVILHPEKMRGDQVVPRGMG